jgi:hypothetical protein
MDSSSADATDIAMADLMLLANRTDIDAGMVMRAMAIRTPTTFMTTTHVSATARYSSRFIRATFTPLTLAWSSSKVTACRSW